jgi:uncharacterized heparinase superfamily protein
MAAGHVTAGDLAGAAARRLRRESSDIANALAFYRLPALSGRAPASLSVAPNALRKGDKGRGAALLSGRFTLAGETLETPAGESVWDLTAPSRRFAAALHRFDWLTDLLAVDDAEARLLATVLVDDWIERFGRWNWFSWSPTILEGRVRAWLFAHAALLDGDGAPRRLATLARQTRRLSRALGVIEPGRPRLDASITLASPCWRWIWAAPWRRGSAARWSASWGLKSSLMAAMSAATRKPPPTS